MHDDCPVDKLLRRFIKAAVFVEARRNNPVSHNFDSEYLLLYILEGPESVPAEKPIFAHRASVS